MGSRPSAFTLTAPGPLRLYSTAELLRMPPPEWLIDPVLPAGGLAGVYGPPGVGKSFIALDMVMSVGAGLDWQGLPTQAGNALYIAAEGVAGISKRALAWCQSRHVSPTQVRVAWLTEAVPVQGDSEDMDRLIDRVHLETRLVPSVVVIDTLARCFDGNENEQEDMGRFISGVDRMRKEFGATVIVVHHTRLDGERERGNTAFRGAADAMIAISRRGAKGDTMLLECNKQKDAEEFSPIALALVPVPGTDSCVVQGKGDGGPNSPQAVALLNVLREVQPVTWSGWATASASLGYSRRTYNRLVVALKESGIILSEKGQYRLKEGI